MIDPKRAMVARAEHGICFICSMCERWHMGDEANLRDAFGDRRCSQEDDCAGPVWGGTFHEYKGPLKGYKTHWCYLCGKESTHLLAPKGNTSDPIGVCEECLMEEVKKLTARDLGPSEHSLWVSERRMEPDRHEVVV